MKKKSKCDTAILYRNYVFECVCACSTKHMYIGSFYRENKKYIRSDIYDNLEFIRIYAYVYIHLHIFRIFRFVTNKICHFKCDAPIRNKLDFEWHGYKIHI